MTDLIIYLFDVGTVSSEIICFPREYDGFLILSLQDSIWHEQMRWPEMIRLLSDPSKFFLYNFRSVSGRRSSDEICRSESSTFDMVVMFCWCKECIEEEIIVHCKRHFLITWYGLYELMIEFNPLQTLKADNKRSLERSLSKIR